MDKARARFFEGVFGGMIPDDFDELDLLAGEYVLGTLGAQQAKVVAEALPSHGALRYAVADWERLLAPLLAAVPAVPPPPTLWRRIEAQLPAAAESGWRAWLRRQWDAPPVWRWMTTGAVAGLLAITLTIPAALRDDGPRYMAILTAIGDGRAGWLVEGRGRVLEPVALAGVTTPSDRDLELWLIADGAPPQPVGLIAPGRVLPVAGKVLAGGKLVLAISLEPKGGSPTGAPTGPVLYSGAMRRLR
ncbi:RNA polymerase subunit sigma-70 [Nitrospirillum viridazoti CBAmc]|uniref:RNA polymerase subunit sigma-70 n=2 Tax=Nitrospirillum TaxID=1543705 RepID=A0A248JTI6_9PROT|nr:RNA polymerase subunit sigma-70 [Nitrospirillum amazonense CBAmc]